MAKVRQSADGANEVTAIWSSVLEEMCSDVLGSKSIMFPFELPASMVSICNKLVTCGRGTYQKQCFHFASRQQMLNAGTK